MNSNDSTFGYPTEVPPPGAGAPSGLFEAAFGFVALVVFGYSLCLIFNGLASYQWNSCHGEVLSSKVESRQEHNGVHDRWVYYPDVHYSFEISGQKLESSNLQPPFNGAVTFLNGDLQSQSTVLRYPRGSTVTVFADAHNPGNCCLEPGINWSTLLFTLMFVILFSIIPAMPLIRRLQDKLLPREPDLAIKTGPDGKKKFESGFRKDY